MPDTKEHDPVNHPSHYTQGKVECIHAIEAALGPEGFIAFLRGQVIKYNWRLGRKGDAGQDASKAQWYQNLLVKRTEEAQRTVKRVVATSSFPEPAGNFNPTVPQPIQGAALTDKKEIHNGSFDALHIYGSAEYLEHTYPGVPTWASLFHSGWLYIHSSDARAAGYRTEL